MSKLVSGITRLIRKGYRLLTLDHPLERVKFALRVCLQDPNLYPLHHYPPFDVDLCVRMFLRNQSLIRSYMKAVGTKPMIYLQPANGIGARRSSWHEMAMTAHLRRRVTPDGMDQEAAVQAVYERVAKYIAERSEGEFWDLTAIFDDVEGNVYIDQAHVSDVGYDMIARKIANDILKMERELSKTSAVPSDPRSTTEVT